MSEAVLRILRISTSIIAGLFINIGIKTIMRRLNTRKRNG